MSSALHDECVPEQPAELARDLGEIAARHRLALGGGTACALHLGHRISRDLELFCIGELDTAALLSDLEPLGPRRLRGISAGELAVVMREVDVSATGLGREPLDESRTWEGLQVLSKLDLAELKVDAAVHRGMARDLCDLHLLCESGVALEQAIHAGGTDLVVAMKALTDPDRYEGQPALGLRRAWSIEEALAFFASEARRIIS
jgi:hypothetical protein